MDPKRVVQIGIRGTQYDSEDLDFAKSVEIRVIKIEEFHDRGATDVMSEAREIVGQDPPISHMILISLIPHSPQERAHRDTGGE